MKKDTVAFVSTFPPRKCGIATFTKDLMDSIEGNGFSNMGSVVIAMNSNGDSANHYDDKVGFQVDQSDANSYLEAADYANGNESIKLVNIQHQFGIFGGKNGGNLLPFLRAIKKPIVTSFHSVIENPDKERRNVVEEICERSSKILVTIEKAKDILSDHYGIRRDKIAVIPHGIHPINDSNNHGLAAEFWENRIIISTFGLINPRKNLENVIESLPSVIKRYPDILYIISGETHPNVKKQEGEQYRNKLIQKVKNLGLEGNVRFINRYLALPELIELLQRTDIYITPYKHENQVSSGTLAYAFGCGRACISTPYHFARELLTDGRGMLVPFGDSGAIGDTILQILDNPGLREKMGKGAYEHSRSMLWPNVAEMHVDVFNRIMNGKAM